MHGIDAVGKFLRLRPFQMDSKACARGIDALMNYQRRYDRASNTFTNEPLHDEWLHGADAFRYAVLSVSEQDIVRSNERALRRLVEQGLHWPKNNRTQTLDEMFAERERKLGIQRRDPGIRP